MLPLQIDCPKESGLVESFQCEQTLINRYRLSLLKPSEKALSLSHKISASATALSWQQCLLRAPPARQRHCVSGRRASWTALAGSS